jgi:hypothetical protein
MAEGMIHDVADALAAALRSQFERENPPAAPGNSDRLDLLEAVRALRSHLGGLALRLEVPGAAQMRQERDSVLEVLDGYLVSRLQAPERPLLAVIGGSTGVGPGIDHHPGGTAPMGSSSPP